jgi:hypothetical protein
VKPAGALDPGLDHPGLTKNLVVMADGRLADGDGHGATRHLADMGEVADNLEADRVRQGLEDVDELDLIPLEHVGSYAASASS